MEDEKINKKSTLLLNYIFENQKPIFSKILIDNKEYSLEEVNHKEIEINFNEIEKEIGSKILNIKLINEFSDDIQNFEIIEDKNTGILFPNFGCIRDIIFPLIKNDKIKIKIISILDGQKIEFDIDSDSKRLLLINFNPNYQFYINDKNLTKQIIFSGPGNSSQICVFDLENIIHFSKPILPQQFDLFFKKYDELKENAKYFWKECENFFNKNENKFNYNEYKNLFIQNELIKILFYKYNFPKIILKEKYNKKEYFDFISSCALYLIMKILKKEEDIKYTYKYFIEYKNDLEKDLNLENYMRNIIIMELALEIAEKRDIEEFKKLEFKYYIKNKLEKDSPLETAINFLDNLIKDLDEKSPFIYPLILIYSGYYSYGKEDAYGFGLINNEILKSLLQNDIPEIVITINDEKINTDKISLNKKLKLDSVKLNLASKILSQLKNYKIDKKEEDKNIKNNLGLILFISLFHQILGFDKDLYSSNTDDNYKSPNVFYDKDKKKILRLINRNCLAPKDNEVAILTEEEKEDAGHFLDYFIGKCEYGFYSEIIEILLLNNININFIFNVNMWNKDIEIMKNYIKLKYIVFIHDKNLLDKKEYNEIGDEIKELEKIIKENKIDLNIIKNINNIRINEGNEKEDYLENMV